MPIKSETSCLIDRIIASAPAPFLKCLGYRKLGRSFNVESGGLFKIIQFQSGMWNTLNRATFTINLKIVLPYFHEKWTGQPFPKNPGSAAPVLSHRIGFLMPENRDLWWEVTPNCNVERMASEIAESLSNSGASFLDHHADLQVLTHVMEREDARRFIMTSPELCLAILQRFQGKSLEAVQVLEELAKKNKLEGFADTIRLIAQRLELKLTN